ncbi:hypothetical protein [Pseudomonas kitaguniensis]|uniref:hypothetical protein n=1 Tax=Pseudomonas kitaguniensis TaxID=2607908 RepID=UPI003BA12BEC
MHNPAGKVSAPALFTEDLPGSQSLQERLLVAENASQLTPPQPVWPLAAPMQ